MDLARNIKPNMSLQLKEVGTPIWTKDLVKAENYSVNNVAASDLRLSFVSIKKSGFRRELSKYEMLEFANIKSVRYH